MTSNKYNVYKDPYFPTESVLKGAKGRTYLDVGYVYTPYVPLQMGPSIMSPHIDSSAKRRKQIRKAGLKLELVMKSRQPGLSTMSTKGTP